MAIKRSKSVLKRQRQVEGRTLRNRAVKTEIKTWVRKVNEALARGDLETAKKDMTILFSRLDKAVKKGVIHRNKSSNQKSAVMKKFGSASKTKST